MASRVFDESRFQPYAVTTNFQDWIFTKRSGIVDFSTSSTDAALDLGGTGNTYLINGTITSAANPGISLGGSDQVLTIGATGVVAGKYDAVSLYDPGNKCVNYGRLFESGYAEFNGAVDMSGDNTTFTNYGIVSGLRAGVYVDATNTKIINEKGGEIHGGITGTFLTDQAAFDIVNRGLIEYRGTTCVEGHDARDELLNEGKIVGDVALGGGNDQLIMRGGSLSGHFLGGTGDDTLTTDNAKTKLTENAGEGDFDMVESSVSYTLSKNVENLTLLGSKNINATGNDDAATNNYIYGNSGDNVLNGHAGHNELFGKGGIDTLIGGSDLDIFGLGKGYGHDTVRGFVDGVDLIDIYKLGVNNFKQLQSHIEKHGTDTWLDFGKDVLILHGIDHRALDASDFLFNY